MLPHLRRNASDGLGICTQEAASGNVRVEESPAGLEVVMHGWARR